MHHRHRDIGSLLILWGDEARLDRSAYATRLAAKPKKHLGGGLKNLSGDKPVQSTGTVTVRAPKDAAGGRPGDKPGPKTEYIMRSALEQLMHIWVWSTGRRRLGTPFENFALILLIGRGFEIHGDDVTDKWPKLFNSVRIVWRKRSSNDGIRYFPTT